jgi:hypothetical protein
LRIIPLVLCHGITDPVEEGGSPRKVAVVSGRRCVGDSAHSEREGALAREAGMAVPLFRRDAAAANADRAKSKILRERSEQ